ncbi:MAG TPA: VWA domain-containing protein [Thermoanaerobaculia bacterium]|nr:VWA domain-containing protein [Thermoanaerobaculia bacterium]
MLRNASRARPRARLAAGAAVAALLAGSAAAQTAPGTPPAPPPPESSFADEVSVAWILVPVTVKSRAGYVRGLDKEDFELKVDGRRIDFPDFEQRGELPWSLVFLQDISGSMALGGRLDASREAIRLFLDQARPGDEFALASFAVQSSLAPTTLVEVPFTEEVGPLRDAIGRWEPYGKTALHDAVARVPEISGSSRNLKRAVILITDGVDNASRFTPEQAREIVRRADLPVYVFGLESGDPNARSESGAESYRYSDVLDLLASNTGGKYFPIHGPEDLKEACAVIAEDLRQHYVLGFETSGRGEVRFHTITVSVSKRAVQVATRKGYRGTPPARR